MAPFALGYLLIFFIPIFISIYYSFFQNKASGGGAFGGGEKKNVFVGFENYVNVITHAGFWQGMGRVVLYTLVQVPIMIGLALLLALLLDSFLIKRVTVFRLGYFLPYAIPGIVAAMVWLYLYSPELSPIVKGLAAIGVNVDFLSKNVILASMANMTTWTFTGYNMLIFLAALQSIPTELYEAARLDGATGFQVATRIKIPMMRGAVLLTVLLSIVGTIQLFNEPQVVSTSQSWIAKDYTPMMMAYNTMMETMPNFPKGDGPASAIAIVMALIAGILASLYALADRKVNK
ncbi:MAG: sugar ABC transporter permease [Actinomycetaceae bacterium]|nr:sugar ABC transporter permease [Actinomycetaceae bacterium]MDY6083460.1 sugar ABC transporter permease [Actinomycetaceae bacterium]